MARRFWRKYYSGWKTTPLTSVFFLLTSKFFCLVVLRWRLLRMLVRMLPDVRWVGFLPPQILRQYLLQSDPSSTMWRRKNKFDNTDTRTRPSTACSSSTRASQKRFNLFKTGNRGRQRPTKAPKRPTRPRQGREMRWAPVSTPTMTSSTSTTLTTLFRGTTVDQSRRRSSTTCGRTEEGAGGKIMSCND